MAVPGKALEVLRFSTGSALGEYEDFNDIARKTSNHRLLV